MDNSFKSTRLTSLCLRFYSHQPVQHPQSSVQFKSSTEMFVHSELDVTSLTSGHLLSRAVGKQLQGLPFSLLVSEIIFNTF